MDSNELKWAQQAGLEGLFNLEWTMLREDLLRDFLQTQEATKDQGIVRQVHGQEILIDQVLIHEQLGLSKGGIIVTLQVTKQQEVEINMEKGKRKIQTDIEIRSMEQLVMTMDTKPSHGPIWTPTKNDVLQYQEIVAPST